MANRTKRSKQKVYKMKGCSKNTRRNKKYLGGSADINLAYPSSNVRTVPNSNLAYSPNSVDISKAYPSIGPAANGFNFLNSDSQTGGCGCGIQSGGATGTLTYACSSSQGCTDNMSGGSAHRTNCKCSKCRGMRGGGMRGGAGCQSNGGLPYPDGLLGKAWTPSVSGWPGVDGISMNRNHLGYNTYAPNDVSRQMVDVGPAAPYLNGVVDAPAAKPYLGGGKRRKSRKSRKSRKNKRGGGTMTNLLGQDFLNVGRQLQFGLGSSYNAIRGFASPVNPLPWKDQMTHKAVQLPS
jgi:hypothetical protein